MSRKSFWRTSIIIQSFLHRIFTYEICNHITIGYSLFVNLFSRIIVSVILTGIYFCIPHFSYAASGKTTILNTISGSERSVSGNTDITPEKKASSGSIKEENSEEIDTEEEEKIKQDINSYIIESYKIQGTKIIKDLSTKLTKTLPINEERKEAYKKIQDSLELRKKRMEKIKMTDTKRLILEEFLDHMIDLLGKKIEELEK